MLLIDYLFRFHRCSSRQRLAVNGTLQSINQFTLPVYWAYQGSQLTGKSENADLEWTKSFIHLLLTPDTTKKNTSLAGEALQESCSKRVKERSSAHCVQKALISNYFWSYVKILTTNPDKSPRDSMSQKRGWTPVLCVLKVCYWVELGWVTLTVQHCLTQTTTNRSEFTSKQGCDHAIPAGSRFLHRTVLDWGWFCIRSA